MNRNILIFLAGLASAVTALVAIRLAPHVTNFIPPQTEAYHFYIQENDKNVPVIELTPQGVLAINLPMIVKAWERQVAEAKKTKQAPAASPEKKP